MVTFTLFVDESGDAGIKSVRTGSNYGASPYMTLAAVLVPDIRISEIEGELLDLSHELKIGKKHCKQLDHDQKVRLSQFVAQKQVLCFGVISNKRTLGGYRQQINSESDPYYNKCSQYLLEKVGRFAKETNNPKSIKIIFEHANFNYVALQNFLRTCQRNPQHPNTQFLAALDFDQLSTEKKDNAPLFRLADLVAHALYKCVDGGVNKVFEPRYLNEMRGRFFAEKDTGKIIGSGIHAIHNVRELGLDSNIEKFLEDLSNKVS